MDSTEKLGRSIGEAEFVLELGGPDQPGATIRRVLREACGALQRRGSDRESTAPPCPVSNSIEVTRDLVVRA